MAFAELRSNSGQGRKKGRISQGLTAEEDQAGLKEKENLSFFFEQQQEVGPNSEEIKKRN